MLKKKLLNPLILKALASSGHGSQVVIADGNFPVASRTHERSEKVFLNLMPGVPSAAQVLEAILDTVPLEKATVMQIPNNQQAPIHAQYRQMLGEKVAWEAKERYDFYDTVASPLTSLVIATAETARFANLILTIGVVKLENEPY